LLIDIRGIGGSTPQGRGFPFTEGAKLGKKGFFMALKILKILKK